MKVKTSITLSKDIVRELEEIAEEGENRSEQIERLLRERLKEKKIQQREARDLAILNDHADELNKEAADVLEYQGEI